MVYVQEFDARPGVTNQQVKDLYLRMVPAWESVWPSNKFLGLYERKFVGSGLRFMAMWEMPNFGAFDEWTSDWPGCADSDFVRLENEFWAAAAGLSSRVMERCRHEGEPQTS
jgi:hypothetical protein